ncbi:MAG: autotransporter outer membrane beta-barrel domain-containing protein [Sulfitobacter sp.]
MRPTGYISGAAVLAGGVLAMHAAPAYAFDGAVSGSLLGPGGGFCMSAINSDATSVAIVGNAGASTGGTSFDLGATIVNTPITPAFLTACGYIDPVIISQNGADGIYATDGYMGITLRARETVGGPFYQYQFGLSGVTGTTVISTRVLAPEESAEIGQFQQSRANLLLQSQPDLIPFLSGSGTGAFDATVTQGAGVFRFAAGGNEQPVWMRLSGAWSQEGTSDTRYVFGAFGAHATVSENFLLGGMFEFDYTDQSDGTSDIDGTGWLAGPYFVARLPEHPVFLEGRLLYGQSANDISSGGAAADNFDTKRFLAQIKVSGEMNYGDTRLFPSVDLSYTSDKLEAYTGAGGAVPSQKVELGQIEVGLGFATPFPSNAGPADITLNGGAYVVHSLLGGAGASAVVSEFDGTRGRIELGVAYGGSDNNSFVAETFYDGIGASGFESFGVQLGYNLEF